MPCAVVRVSIACPKNTLPNGYSELTVSPCTSGLDNARHDAATMVTVLAKRRRNSGCAVAALPPELLSYVFSMNVLSDRPGQKNGKYNLGWISATQVCHRWREIALATPSLWRYLDFTCMSRRWCSEMLRRSGNCSLQVALRIATSSGLFPARSSLDAARELVRPECSRRLAGCDLLSFAASLCLPSETCAEIKTNGRAWVDTLLPQYELTFGPVRRLKLLANPNNAPFRRGTVAPGGCYCWHALFAHATQLRQIRATYRGAVDGLILQVFLAATHDDNESRLLPSLRSVKLSLVDLDEAVDTVDPPRARGDLLFDGLARRRSFPGSEIRELEVPDHDGRWVAKLQQIVPGVVHAWI
ncbi:hypothetical protein EI94DRAFT_1789685 [Lactarius quietus]|nr:hypothetical protein EI94DRAFT_1789685 [Lactarius quietus]